MCYKISTAAKENIYHVMVDKGYKVFDYFSYYHADGFNRPMVSITTNQEPKVLQPAQWKLLPASVMNEAEANAYANTLNAACETIFIRESFAPYKSQRCVIWVDGFFEPHHPRPKVSIPFYIHMPEKRPFTLGGLWTDWLNHDTGENKKTFAIITTPANELLSQIHNDGKRMPLIIDRSDRNRWLQGGINDMVELMKPYKDGELQAYPVDSFINKRNIGNTDLPQAQFKRA